VFTQCSDCGFTGTWKILVFESPATPTPTPTPSPSPPPVPNISPTAGFTLTFGSHSATEGSTLDIVISKGSAVVNFVADRSLDPDGSVAGWQWMLDGIAVSNSYNFSTGVGRGTHTVSLAVSDNQGALSQVVTGTIVVTVIPLKPLVLFSSSSGAVSVSAHIDRSKRTDNKIIADVTMVNLTGAWFYLEIQQGSSSDGAPNPLGDSSVPLKFLLAPTGIATFSATFQEGQYLEYKADLISTTANLALALDMTLRGIFGVELQELSNFSGQLDLTIGLFAKFFEALAETGYADALIELTNCIRRLSIPCFISQIAALLEFAVTHKATRDALKKLLTELIGGLRANKFFEWTTTNAAQLDFALLQVMDTVPSMGTLFVETFLAIRDNSEGLARIECRRLQ
jgi:PKD repeat protein